MTNEKRTIRVIESLTRLKNSVNGNPRYTVHFTDGSTAGTASDRSFCYGIDNPEMRKPNQVAVTFTKAGLIDQMSPVKDDK